MVDCEKRNRRIQVFEDTLQFCERERELVDSIAMSREQTVLFGNLQGEEGEGVLWKKLFENKCDLLCRLESLGKDALHVIGYLKKKKPTCRVAVLSFSDSTSLGGNVLRGGLGWEEMLCRCTTLYPCLDQEYIRRIYCEIQGAYLEKQGGAVCVYVPDVVCIRNNENLCDRLQCEDRFSFDVIQYMSLDMDLLREG